MAGLSAVEAEPVFQIFLPTDTSWGRRRESIENETLVCFCEIPLDRHPYQFTERIHRLGLLERTRARSCCNSARLWGRHGSFFLLRSWRWSCRGRWWSSCFGFRVERSDLKLLLILLQDAFVVILPKLLAGIFASDTLQDCVLFVSVWPARHVIVRAILFFPPGCSSWKFVRSYTSSSTTIQRESGLE